MKKSDARKKTEKNEKNTKKTCFFPEKNTKWKKRFFSQPYSRQTMGLFSNHRQIMECSSRLNFGWWQLQKFKLGANAFSV